VQPAEPAAEPATDEVHAPSVEQATAPLQAASSHDADEPESTLDESVAEAPASKSETRGPGRRKQRDRGREGPDELAVEYTAKFPPPNKRHSLPPELERELQEALGDMAIDDLMSGTATAASAQVADLAPDSRLRGRVVSQHNENVFVDLGGPSQGVLSLRQFSEPPEPGTEVDVVVLRFDAEDGLYELSLAGAAAAVGDWSDLAEGMIVEAAVTGHNKGGLECAVNNLRGFIPAGQASIYRVEDLSTLVGERFACVVTECNPERRNLVLSRRAVLEREQAEAKKKLLEELAPGQIREGVVRNIRDFGAFIDLGGVDGLLHIGQLSWARVRHPSDLLQIGQSVKVKVLRIDPDTKKISLGMRDLFENPWNSVASKYPTRSTVRGRVTKLMEFGAFVEIEPGIEGLVHISELSHKRVWRTSDVVQEGDEVEVQVLSVDADAQKIGLSIKALQARAAPVKKDDEDEAASDDEAAPIAKKTPSELLKGGRSTTSGGEKFGLKW